MSLKTKANDFVVKPPSDAGISNKERFYIELFHENFASYKLPNRKPWAQCDSDIRTNFTKIRYDPHTLRVDTSDYTFATTSGKVSHHPTVQDRVPYATAFGCESPENADGEARIDLRGTPYAVDDVFTHRGYISAGSVVVSERGQVVVLRGGGYCGWIAPRSASNEDEAHIGGFYLQLKLLPVNPFFYDTDGTAWINLPEGNTSGYKLPTRKPWLPNDSDLTVTWNKIRVDPITLAVYTNDYRHSTSSGRVSHDNDYVYVSFGGARGCESSWVADGTAKINLNGTGFKFTANAETLWSTGGWEPAGSVTITPDRKQATVRGGGYCGWNTLPGGFAGGAVQGLIQKE